MTNETDQNGKAQNNADLMTWDILADETKVKDSKFIKFEAGKETKLVITNWKPQRNDEAKAEFYADVLKEDGVSVNKVISTASVTFIRQILPLVKDCQESIIAIIVVRVGEKEKTQYAINLTTLEGS